MTLVNANAFASGISRALRKADIKVLGSGADITAMGVHVSRSQDFLAYVLADTGTRSATEALTDRIVAALTKSGYTIAKRDDYDPVAGIQVTVIRELPARKGPYGTASNPRRGGNLGTYCRQCKSTDLWSSYFDAEGNGCPGDQDGATYLTMCQSCSTFYDTGRRAH